MGKTGAELIRFALEQIGVKFTFGIPGVHTTEIYDQLSSSELIRPILVTHECGGAFMADAISRTSNSIGTLLVVPAAGITHAASGIGEAGLDGIPMLIISGGVHSESGRKYQLHDVDQHTLLSPITKGTFKVLKHSDVISTVYQAFDLATQGEPGPVYIEVPYNIANFKGDVDRMPNYEDPVSTLEVNLQSVRDAVQLINQSKQVGLFVGWGTANCESSLVSLAEMLNAPVATTLQGLSVFPANHPLHTGMGFGEYAVPAAFNAFKSVDCLIAIGTRFSEISTGSYGINVPKNLIHIDINPTVFNANYSAKVTIEGDAKDIVSALLNELSQSAYQMPKNNIVELIKQQKKNYQQEWLAHDSKDRVNPIVFFNELRKQLNDDAIVVADDGNHTFLAAELFPIHQSKHFISPSDFNAMGYCVPAVIGAKLANPNKQVVGIVGDGGFLMTCLETITATHLSLGCIFFVFNDGELSQISQAQTIPYNRKTCSVLPKFKPEGVAIATGAEYLHLGHNNDVEPVILKALEIASKSQPVIVDVAIDYSKPTRFTQGVVKTNLNRFSIREKVRAISRAIYRKFSEKS